jgi:hypothetical protein
MEQTPHEETRFMHMEIGPKQCEMGQEEQAPELEEAAGHHEIALSFR